jgi:hypothetical protein
MAEHTRNPFLLKRSISQMKLGRNDKAVSVVQVLNRISLENRRLHLMAREETHLQMRRYETKHMSACTWILVLCDY